MVLGSSCGHLALRPGQGTTAGSWQVEPVMLGELTGPQRTQPGLPTGAGADSERQQGHYMSLLGKRGTCLPHGTGVKGKVDS